MAKNPFAKKEKKEAPEAPKAKAVKPDWDASGRIPGPPPGHHVFWKCKLEEPGAVIDFTGTGFEGIDLTFEASVALTSVGNNEVRAYVDFDGDTDIRLRTGMSLPQTVTLRTLKERALEKPPRMRWGR